jgi:hypothetical protein
MIAQHTEHHSTSSSRAATAITAQALAEQQQQSQHNSEQSSNSIAQHRQACLARWPGHQEQAPKLGGGGEELTGVLTEEHDGRPWRRHDGAATVVATRPPSSSCTDEEAATCSWQSTARWRRRGCGGRPTDAKPRRSPPAPPSTGRSSSKLAGVDRATRARSTEAELDGDGGDWRRG